MAFDASRKKFNRRQAVTLIGAGAIVPLMACKGRSSASPVTESKVIGDLYYMSLREVARRIQSRDLSPVDLTRLMLNRIEEVDPRIKSYATMMTDQALADAHGALQEIEAGRYRGPLHGVPIGIKDLCYTKGVRTMGGTAVLKDFVPTFDGTVVSKLRSAGAVVLGKLNLSEGAAAGYNPSFDVPINPWRADRWPGMSSSGSGVATAAGLCSPRSDRHRGIDSDASVGQRSCGPEADLWPGEPLWSISHGAFTRPRRVDGPHGS